MIDSQETEIVPNDTAMEGLDPGLLSQNIRLQVLRSLSVNVVIRGEIW